MPSSARLLRVVRTGGFVYLSVPDMRHTFDRDRTPTSVAHTLEDHEQGPAGSRHAAELEAKDFRIHFPGRRPSSCSC